MQKSPSYTIFIVLVLANFVHSLGGFQQGLATLQMFSSPVMNNIKKYIRSSAIPSLRLQLALSSPNIERNRPNISEIDIDDTFYNNYYEVGTRVVTDIDDTVKSSGGIKLFGIPLGGIDVQYSRGVFYPGAFQFAFELTHSSFNKRNQKHGQTEQGVSPYPPKVAVLTARAKEFKFALALKPGDKISTAYNSIGKHHGLEDWGIGQVYYGSVKEWIFQKRKGLRKFKNFEIMMEHDSKHNRISDYILIGDTGEKDEDAGERIALKYGPSRMKAIFLHVVSDNHDDIPSKGVKLPKDRICNHVPIYYFRTYVGAASKAFQAKLIGAESVQRIISNAVVELKQLDDTIIMNRESGVDGRSRTEAIIGALPSSSTPPTVDFTKSRWEDLHNDINEARLVVGRKFIV